MTLVVCCLFDTFKTVSFALLKSVTSHPLLFFVCNFVNRRIKTSNHRQSIRRPLVGHICRFQRRRGIFLILAGLRPSCCFFEVFTRSVFLTFLSIMAYFEDQTAVFVMTCSTDFIQSPTVSIVQSTNRALHPRYSLVTNWSPSDPNMESCRINHSLNLHYHTSGYPICFSFPTPCGLIGETTDDVF